VPDRTDVDDLCQACCELARGITIDNVRDHVVGIDRRVPLFDGRLVPYVNLDNAATTPPFGPVVECARQFLNWYASVHRGSGFKSLLSTHVYERCRGAIAEFVGADLSHHALIFTQNATHALNKLAMHVCPTDGRKILTTVMEHHSNMLPWRKLGSQVDYVRIERADGSLDLADLEDKIRRSAPHLSLVTVTGASNVTGIMPPIRRIARLAHAHGALLAVDASQLVPHRALKMGAPDDPERIDFLAFSGHKMYAPLGTGVLVGPRSAFEERDPDHVGGGTVHAVTMDDVMWAALPEKEEAGTPNVLGCLALACATKVLESIGMDNVAEHERQLTRRALSRLGSLDGLTLYGPLDAELRHDRIGVITLNAEGFSHAKLAAILGHEWGIGVRNGCFCAQPYVRELLGITDDEMRRIVARLAAGDHATVPGMVRISFGVYNTIDEVDHLVEALRSILSDGPRANYILDDQYLDYVPYPAAVRIGDYSPL
jgi:cysteine desulfurase/selenocysteine lyase